MHTHTHTHTGSVLRQSWQDLRVHSVSQHHDEICTAVKQRSAGAAVWHSSVEQLKKKSFDRLISDWLTPLRAGPCLGSYGSSSSTVFTAQFSGCCTWWLNLSAAEEEEGGGRRRWQKKGQQGSRQATGSCGSIVSHLGAMRWWGVHRPWAWSSSGDKWCSCCSCCSTVEQYLLQHSSKYVLQQCTTVLVTIFLSSLPKYFL